MLLKIFLSPNYIRTLYPMAAAASPHSLAGFRRVFGIVLSNSDCPSIDGIAGLLAL